ncbi:putative WRKY transcription factor 13 [Dichanthelium oligosanthes]|uniref:Putative WRKY transcription factor 13 n=1 Tax=Dichanthelium oligosanthes TaxID=888268 RepID=A0A1E5WH29_9POAL|nr:putative WRKY transcription factor 13 [Dichanthelium oligosanthes]
MFPSPGRAVVALGHGQHTSSTAGAAMAAAAAATSSTPTITFAFQPPPPPTSSLAHHGVLGYSSLLLDHPPTATTSSSSSHAPSSTIPPPTLHHLHAAHVSPPTRSSPPPHPWSTCDEGHDQGQGRQRGKGAAVSEGLAAAGHNGAAALGVGAVRMKKAGGGGKARRKVREPRFCFKTMSDVDVLDDGYKWRKYGQKVVKNTQHPRSYYRCTQDNCRVKKRVERLAEDPRMVITTYEGRHVHSPSRDEDDDAARANAEMSFIW